MDKRIRRNEICIIGQPRCDFAFSSTRTCFIAYGFEESTLEMTILKQLLESEGIQPIEAGGSLVPGQSAFCAKICSKIITSQFCIVLLNNDERNNEEIPNANVNMEYGLMLGFNKYVIPFQRDVQKLPFNVSGLDTIKYTNKDFERRANAVIVDAISATAQENVPTDSSDQLMQMFLLGRNMLVAPLDSDDERNIYRLGEPIGMNLLTNFAGDHFIYFARFATLRKESVIWRLRKFNEILNGRRSNIPSRVESGITTPEAAKLAEQFFVNIRILIVVTSKDDKEQVIKYFDNQPIEYSVEVICFDDVLAEIQSVRPQSI